MSWITRAAASVALAFALSMSPGSTTCGVPAPQADPNATTDAADTCYFTVTADLVNVRSAPDRAAHVIKKKTKGDRVTGPCNTVFNDGRRWTEVRLDGGGTAWMARSLLQYQNRS